MTMPSTKKTLHFMSSALFTSISIGLLGYSISTKWVEISMDCAVGGTDNFNGSATITLSLFNGTTETSFCPFFGMSEGFKGNFIMLQMATLTFRQGIIH